MNECVVAVNLLHLPYFLLVPDKSRTVCKQIFCTTILSSSHIKSGTSWICTAMAAFVSKSSVWILSMYSSFFSHWKQKCKEFQNSTAHVVCSRLSKHKSSHTQHLPGLHTLTATAKVSWSPPDFVLQRLKRSPKLIRLKQRGLLAWI